jgi:PST family polysaccharide transporter
MVLQSSRMLAAVVVPVGVLVAATADDIVPLLYGPQWLPMIPVLAALGFSIAVRASTAVMQPIFNAKDRVGMALYYSAIGTALTLLGIISVLDYGIDAVAAVLALASLYALVGYRIALRLVGIGLAGIWQALGPPFVGAAVAALVIWLLRPLLAHIDLLILRLLVKGVIGTCIYLVVVATLSPRLVGDAQDVMARFSPNRLKRT